MSFDMEMLVSVFNQIIKKIKQSGFYDGFVRLVVGGTF